MIKLGDNYSHDCTGPVPE